MTIFKEKSRYENPERTKFALYPENKIARLLGALCIWGSNVESSLIHVSIE